VQLGLAACRSALTSEVLPAPEGAAMTNRRPRLGEEGMGRETYTGSSPICKESPGARVCYCGPIFSRSR